MYNCTIDTTWLVKSLKFVSITYYIISYFNKWLDKKNPNIYSTNQKYPTTWDIDGNDQILMGMFIKSE